MTPSQFTAESLLRTYLGGRSMPKILRDAVVWVIEARLTNNETPTLDEALRMLPQWPGQYVSVNFSPRRQS